MGRFNQDQPQQGGNGQFDIGKDFMNFLGAQGGGPMADGSLHPEGNDESPTEVFGGNTPPVPGNPDFPRSATPPSPEAQLGQQAAPMGGSQPAGATPSAPASPTPAQGSSTFAPMPAPSAGDLVGLRKPMGMAGGGLFGGGLEAPGKMSTGSENPDSLLALLAQLIGQ